MRLGSSLERLRFITKKKSIYILLSLPLLYIASYLPLSATGSYALTQSGQHRFTMGLAISDSEIWFPRWANWQPFQDVEGHRTSRGNPLGYFYAPLIYLDQTYWHPTRKLF